MRRCPSAPLGSKIADKATQMSGFVCDFVSLVGVDGFECRVNISIGASSVRAKPELTAH